MSSPYQAVGPMARKAAELASAADSPTANEDYQHEKISAAWETLTLALFLLGVGTVDLHDGIDRASKTPLARYLP